MCSCVCFWYEIIQGAEGIHIQPGFQTERKVKRQAAYLFLHLLPPHFQKSRLYSIVFACTYCQLPKDMSNPDSLVCLDSSHPNSWILSASWNSADPCLGLLAKNTHPQELELFPDWSMHINHSLQLTLIDVVIQCCNCPCCYPPPAHIYAYLEVARPHLLNFLLVLQNGNETSLAIQDDSCSGHGQTFCSHH